MHLAAAALTVAYIANNQYTLLLVEKNGRLRGTTKFLFSTFCNEVNPPHF